MTEQINKEPDKRLEKLGLELYVIRKANSLTKKKDEELTKETKRIMLKELEIRNYRGEGIDLRCREQDLPRHVDPKIASKYIPLDNFLSMVVVDKEKFEMYIKEKGIELKEEEYLISPGTHDVLETPKLKLSFNAVKTQLKILYDSLVDLLMPNK